MGQEWLATGQKVLESQGKLCLDLGAEGLSLQNPSGQFCMVVKNAIATGPHGMGDRQQLFDQGDLPGLNATMRIEQLEILFLDVGPLETNLAKEEVLPPNEVLFLCHYKCNGVG